MRNKLFLLRDYQLHLLLMKGSRGDAGGSGDNTSRIDLLSSEEADVRVSRHGDVRARFPQTSCLCVRELRVSASWVMSVHLW